VVCQGIRSPASSVTADSFASTVSPTFHTAARYAPVEKNTLFWENINKLIL